MSNCLPSDHYIVGIGASAGGLEAINELFDNIPAGTGFSFVVVQHLSPDHKSMMAELLSKHTEMPVFEAEEGMSLKPDAVYLLPIKKTMQLEGGMLHLQEYVRDTHPNSAIDIFFESLAQDKGDKAVAIILSGTGSDGTKGVQAIKNHGGIVIIQDPLSAQFDGMPNSAVASGYVDLILSPDMMADELLEFVKEAPLLRSFNALNNEEENLLLNILELLYKTTGHDFSNYKRPTINRRLAKRMSEKGIRSIADYYNHLNNHPEEVKNLCKEFLLHVTRFFRDEEAFDLLKDKVIEVILSKKEKNETVKIWSVACSTGEEAYSLAILVDECAASIGKPLEIKIFATDISQDVIETASRGLYSEESLKSVSAERLSKYFVREGIGYRVTADLRKMIVFARHDIAKDPAFGKIDLLACRNMLIYVNVILQKTILQKFHFALNEDSYLFLGPSENIGVLKDVMEEVDRKWKIYKCISKVRIGEAESFSNPFEKFNHAPLTSVKSKNALHHLTEVFKETLLEEYDYAGIFIDREFEVKQAIGHFKKFLDFPEGQFNFNLLKLVPTDLSIVLSTGIRKAIKENERVVQRHVKLQSPTGLRFITVIIKPYLGQKAYMQPFIFIVLKEEEQVKAATPSSYYTREEYTTDKIQELEQELLDTKENLQALIEEVESSNEELQSSNEEIISSNEELQSTNEELQSLNEELHTVNAEHQLKIKELIELNDDLNNHFRNTDIGQIFIDRKLHIRKFNTVATKQVNLKPSDIGRSIADISTNIINLNFINEIKQAMLNGKQVEKEISIQDEKVYLLRIVPYLRQNDVSDGVVVSFVDVTEIKRLNTILEAVFNSSTSGIAALSAMRNAEGFITDFRFITANKASRDLLHLDGEGLVDKTYKELYSYVDSQVFDTYVHIVETGKTATFEFYNEERQKWFEVIGVKMMDGLVITFNDITLRKTATERIEQGFEALKATTSELEHTNQKLEQSNFDLMQFASVASHDLKEPLRKVQAFGNLLKDRVKTKLDEVEMNYLNKVVSSTHRMHLLIDDILTLSRLSKNNTPYEEVNLNKVVEQIIDDLEISIKEKGAEIKVETLPKMNGIPGQMHQAFQNLISNAVKFNQQKPLIEIGTMEIPPGLENELGVKAETYNAVFIKDNGIGFDPQYSEKIFGVFQRLEKASYQGTGIGLAIVKKIVENHKGFIKAESEEGKGSRFIVLLPKM